MAFLDQNIFWLEISMNKAVVSMQAPDTMGNIQHQLLSVFGFSWSLELTNFFIKPILTVFQQNHIQVLLLNGERCVSSDQMLAVKTLLDECLCFQLSGLILRHFHYLGG